jgi:hypothetical protein
MTSPKWILYKRIRELEHRVNLLEELFLDQFPLYSEKLGISVELEISDIDEEELPETGSEESEECIELSDSDDQKCDLFYVV